MAWNALVFAKVMPLLIRRMSVAFTHASVARCAVVTPTTSMVASRSVSDSDNEFTTWAVPLKVYTSSAGKLEMCHLDCSHFSSLNASRGGF